MVRLVPRPENKMYRLLWHNIWGNLSPSTTLLLWRKLDLQLLGPNELLLRLIPKARAQLIEKADGRGSARLLGLAGLLGINL